MIAADKEYRNNGPRALRLVASNKIPMKRAFRRGAQHVLQYAAMKEIAEANREYLIAVHVVGVTKLTYVLAKVVDHCPARGVTREDGKVVVGM
jgi:hypothetical protein